MLAEKIITIILTASAFIICLDASPRLLVFVAIGFVLLEYILFYLPSNIEYDERHIFIQKKKESQAIAFRNVYQLKMTGLRVGSRTIWKIRYNSDRKEGVARFYPRNYSSNFSEFVNLLRQQNPRVEINVKGSFDFDF